MDLSDPITIYLRARHGIPQAEARLDAAREADWDRPLGDWSEEQRAAFEDLERRAIAASRERDALKSVSSPTKG